VEKTLDPRSLFDISGKVALITGSTGGLGKAAAKGLCAAGAKVMLTGREAAKLKVVCAEIEAEGGTAAYEPGRPDDITDMQRIVAAAVKHFGGIDILITAAGMNKPRPIIEQSLEEWQAIMDANVKGTYLACKEVGKLMISQGRGGKVVIISSTRGKLGMANYTAYCPSKGAVDSLTKALAWEWGPNKINVNAIAPTVFRTALTQWMFDDQAAYKKFLARIPIGRLAEPEDFIGVLIFLSSRASDFMTGSVVYIDGGYTAG
jgi:NAD(P)-dependent dehydrogenase (short-subunit alcohol dehydrogenase family)